MQTSAAIAIPWLGERPRLLLVGGERRDLAPLLRAIGCADVAVAADALAARTVLRERGADIVVLDLAADRRQLLDIVKSLRLEFPRIALVARGPRDETGALDLVAAGVNEYIDLDAGAHEVARALRLAEARARRGLDDGVQRQAIATIERNERRYRDLFEYSLGLFCTHDIDGVLLALNPAAAAALGYSVSELIGRPLADFVPSPLRREFAAYLKRIADRHSDTGLLYLVHRSGEQRIWEFHNRLVFEADGTPFVMGSAQDVTANRVAERRLRQQRAAMEAVNDAALVGLFHTDAAGSWTYVNTTYERISGLYAAQAARDGWLDAVHPDDRDRVAREWTHSVENGRRYRSDHRYVHADGRVTWVHVQAAPIVLDGDVTGHVGCVEDVTARRHAEQSLKRSEQRLRTIADALPAMIFYLDAKQRFVFANAAYERVYGGGRGVAGRYLRDVLDAANYEQRRPWLARAFAGERVCFELEQTVDGVVRHFEFNYIPQRDDENPREIAGIHALVLDVTPQKHEAARLTQLAQVDPLTGLVNRAGFAERLTRALARSRDQRTTLATMYLDVDHFKQINDTHGHAVGDALLKAFAQRLVGCLRSSDVAGRLGGDEFAVISESVRRREYAAAVAAKIVTAMRKPFVLDDLTLNVTTSVGLAFGTGAESADAILHSADTALYRVKQAGRNGYRVAE
ncbi:PAS domain S-box protein [Tahibacter soli]|uniref:PAS domain S-box protein n=1 Tax=Tahibacter soli TaxID=2983605 RepID=A0A9X3YME9_9GAMM|nr:PAS domain S-box protein [Tahibacter soli]MDC8013930.1 PAS domain S-box protein [Tahibacter soli]